MPFKYKTKARPPIEKLNRLEPATTKELLTGYVKGQAASDIEERFARALNQQEVDYQFQVPVTLSIPGQENQIDFVVDGRIPVEVDGTFTHKTAAQKAEDQLRDALLNEELRDAGFLPIIRIPGSRLETEEDARRTLEAII